MENGHVLIVGAGFGGLETAIRLARKRPRTRVTLVNPSEYLTYRPWLIYLPARKREAKDLRISLTGAARRFGFTLRVDTVTGLDPDGAAQLDTGEQIRFSHCVVATGARTDLGQFAGADEHAHAPCDFDHAVRFADAFHRLEEGHVTIVIAGERPGPGLEYAGWLVRALETPRASRTVRIQVIDEGGLAAAVLGPQAFPRVVDHFVSRGHSFYTNVKVSEIGRDRVQLADGDDLHSDLTAVVGTLRGVDIGLPSGVVDGRGFVNVDQTLRSTAHPALFAVGDAAGLPGDSYLPKSMIMARRQARTVAANVTRVLDGEEPQPFDFQRAWKFAIAMPDIGGRTVVVRKQKLIMSGRLPLLLRSFIDRSFFRAHNYTQ